MSSVSSIPITSEGYGFDYIYPEADILTKIIQFVDLFPERWCYIDLIEVGVMLCASLISVCLFFGRGCK